MVIACLPSETTYDVQCTICGRGFLFLTDAAEADRAAMRRCAITALAAQHNKLKGRSDRRRSADRRKGQPDVRAVKQERRQAQAVVDRRDPDHDRRDSNPEQRGTEQERRTAAPAFRRGSGIAHPREVFYLQGWDGHTERDGQAWMHTLPTPSGALC